MSNFKIRALLSLLVASLCSMATAKPVRSQVVTAFRGDRQALAFQGREPVTQPQLQNVPSLLANGDISTKARDLFDESSINDYLVQNLDLEEFCREYPYNSQCRGINPGNSDTIPVPVPPPAPSESNRNNSSNGQKTGWAIAPEVSTLGLGGHVVRRIIPQINARVGINAFGLSLDIEETDVEYEGDLNLFNVSTILDLHPVKSSGFKLSGGLIFANNNVEGTATTEETIEIGGQEFSVEELGSVDADIDITRDVAPYVGIGWGNAVRANKGLGFWFNAGVMFGGSPEVSLNPNISQDVPADVVAEINEAVEAEEEELEDDIGFFEFYPVVSLGISYQF